MDVIAPSQVTESHVTIDVSGFSCFGLVTEMRRKGAIKGLVVVFSQMAEGNLFALMLPRNICLTQVHRLHTDLSPPVCPKSKPATGRAA